MVDLSKDFGSFNKINWSNQIYIFSVCTELWIPHLSGKVTMQQLGFMFFHQIFFSTSSHTFLIKIKVETRE